MDIKRTETAIVIGGLRLPFRKVEVEHDGHSMTLLVPRGIARNNRNKSWQIKIQREGVKEITGNVSDGAYSPLESLNKAIDHIAQALEASNSPIRTLRSKGRGDRVKPYRVSDQVTLHWKLVNTTPSLYAQVYSPLLKKAKAVNIGSEKRIEDFAFVCERMKQAFVYGARVKSEEKDPFRPVPDGLMLAVHDMTASYVKDCFADPLFQEFLADGLALRGKAEEQRATNLNNGGIKSALALKVLTGHRV